MALGFYFATFIISCIFLAIFMALWQKKSHTYFSIIFWVIAVSNGGYLALALSNTLEKAILANKILYVAACFLPLLFFLNITTICKVKLPKKVVPAMVLYCAVPYFLVLSTGYTRIYYKSIELHSMYGISYITKTYGPWHLLYTVSLFGFNIANLIIIIFSFRKKNRLSYINSITLLIMELIATAVYIIERAAGSIIDWMPLVYIIFSAILFILYIRVEMYDVSTMASDTFEHHQYYGYLMLNNQLKYIGSNSVARNFFPALNDLKIDYPLDFNNEFYARIKKKINKLTDEIQFTAWHQNVNEYELKCSLRYLYYRNRRSGYLLEITDDTQQQKYIRLINNYNDELETEVKRQTKHIKDIQAKIILGMSNMVETRDTNTGGHIKRTSDVVRILVNAMKASGTDFNVNDSFYKKVIKAAPMHDLGKIGVDDSILRKPDKFTDEEYEQMKLHTVKGVSIIDTVLDGVEDMDFVTIAKNIAHYHHEKWNGSGYPEGLSGYDIPLEARIMALADVFDALVSERCYKARMPYNQAFSIIEESLGTHFDPIIGRIFLSCRQQLEEYYG